MRVLTLLAIFLLTACADTYSTDYSNAFKKKKIAEPQTAAFEQCHGYGCKYKTPVAVDNNHWQKIASYFHPAPQDAADERLRIKKAIGYFEKMAGEQTGTSEDIHGTFKKLGRHQLDCSDESLNTTIYLVMLQKRGLLKFHRPGAPDGRFPVIHAGIWPHKTATIVETASGRPYAVDSWFHDNGKPAEIVPLEKWKAGWEPDNFQGG